MELKTEPSLSSQTLIATSIDDLSESLVSPPAS
jgi:hypothetical protein